MVLEYTCRRNATKPRIKIAELSTTGLPAYFPCSKKRGDTTLQQRLHRQLGFSSDSRHLMPHISWFFLLPMVGLAMVVKWEQLICRWGRASFNSWRVPSGTIPKTCSVFNVGISPSSLERKREIFRVAVSVVTVPLELHDPIFTHCILYKTNWRHNLQSMIWGNSKGESNHKAQATARAIWP